MSQFAILLEGPERRPRTVRLAEDGGCLTLVSSDRGQSQVAWWRLFRLEDEGTTHRFARLDERNWELRVTSGADQVLLSHVGKRPLARLFYPFRRLQSVKTLIGAIVLAAAVAQHLPSEWVAKAITPTLQHRLVDGAIAQNASQRCAREGGEETIRKLLLRLDPALGARVKIVGLNVGDFMTTAAPAGLIVVTRGVVQQTDPEAMAALLAHQLSHLRHGDPVVAMVRHEGAWGIGGALLEGRLTNGIRMDYSGLEERRADLEAIAMLRAARISLAPAARLFEEIRVSRAQGTYVAYEYRDFHFGIEAQSKHWAEAAFAQRGTPTTPALDRDGSDDLFNFCWAGKLPAASIPPDAQPRPPSPPGQGSVPGKDSDTE